MAKLTGAAKAAFLAKMRAGKRKAAPKRRATRRKNPSTVSRFGKHKVTLVRSSKGWNAPKSKRAAVKSGTRINPKRRRRSIVRRNPMSLSGLKASVLNKANLMKAAGAGAGFVAGVKLQTWIDTQAAANPTGILSKLPDNWRGVLNVVAGLILAGYAKQEVLKAVGLGVAGSGVYDIISKNIAAAKVSPLAGADVPWAGDLVQVGADVPWAGDLVQVGDDEMVADLLGDDDDDY